MPLWFDAYVIPPALLLIGGFGLWWGGDKLVQHAARLARSVRVPKHVVGAVVLGFGTSLPELLVCLTAAIENEPGIAIGNVVGSNIANVGLILGLAAVISSVLVERKLVGLDLPLGLIVAAVLALWLYPDGGTVGRGAGGLLLAVFALYLALTLRAARSHRRQTEKLPQPRIVEDLIWVVIGLVSVALGAKAFVEGAQSMALVLGVPSEIIGLTLVALGTSLPELVTTVAAARHGHPELAVGNVAGSNIFNLLLVLGTTAAVRPVAVSPTMVNDVIVMTGFAVVAFPLFGRRQLRRSQGTLLLALYVGYLAWLLLQGRAA